MSLKNTIVRICAVPVVTIGLSFTASAGNYGQAQNCEQSSPMIKESCEVTEQFMGGSERVDEEFCNKTWVTTIETKVWKITDDSVQGDEIQVDFDCPDKLCEKMPLEFVSSKVQKGEPRTAQAKGDSNHDEQLKTQITRTITEEKGERLLTIVRTTKKYVCKKGTKDTAIRAIPSEAKKVSKKASKHKK